MRYAKPSRPYAKKRPVRRAARKPRTARKSITKIVKSIISRQAENKAWFDYGANQAIYCTSGGTPTNKNLVPLLNQGTGHSQKIGNEVRVKSAYIRGHVNILPYDATLNPAPLPLYVKIWITSCKSQHNTALSVTDIGNAFFDIVNSSVGFQGSMLDMDFTPNKDSWTVHASKVFKIGVGYSSATGPTLVNSYFDNSPMSVPFYFNIGKYLKTIKYSDNNVPTNRNLFIVFQAVPANGSAPVGNAPAEFHYSTRVEYEDM